jgi:PAS domain S-box-containing protein
MNLEQFRNLQPKPQGNIDPEPLNQELFQLECQFHQLQQQLVAIQQQNETYAQESTFQSSLLEQVCNAVIATDLQGTILYWNHYAEKIYQWQASEVLGQNIVSVLAPAEGQRIARQMVSQGFRVDLWQGKLLLHRQDGSEVWVEVKHTLLKNRQQEPIGFIGVSIDITDKILAEAALQTAHAELELRVAQRTQELAQMNAILQAEIRDRRNTELALRQSEDALARRERLLTVLVNIQTWLLTHVGETQVYEKVLEPLGRIAGADRVYLFENQRDINGNLLMSQRYEWCAETVTPQIHNPRLQNLPYDSACPTWKQTLERNWIINCTIADFPPAERKTLEGQGILAILLLPLFVNSEFWGFIGFDNCREARLWDGVEVNLLGAAASSISMTLEHQLAEQRLQNQSKREQLLGAIALRIRESLDLEEILGRTVDEIRQFLLTDRVLIYRFDGPHGILVAASVLPKWTIDSSAASHQIWYRNPDAQYARYEWGQTYVVNDIEHQGLPADYLDFMRRLQVKAKLVVPIIQSTPLAARDGQPDDLVADRPSPEKLQEGSLWGVLAVHQCSAVRQWQLFEIDLVQKLAVQVAIAIQQAQLFTQVQQQAQREHLLNQLSKALNSSLDPAHILQEIVNRTGEGFGVDRAVIYMLDEEILAINEWRASETISSILGFRYPLSDWPDLPDPTSAFNQGQAFYSLDLSVQATTTALQVLVNELQTRSVLCAPIIIRDRIFGALALHTTTCHRTFTQEEVQLLHQIAGHAAIALYNAQSYSYLEQLVKQRTRELEQEKLTSDAANRAKSEFLATMSHELRTPLNAILGLSQVLQREIFGNLTPKQLEYINHIHSSGEHLLMLINDILDLAKVESGHETIMPKWLSVTELCHYCLALVQEEAQERQLQLISQLDPAIDYYYADERRLRQMLLNLLSNAVKFTPTGSVSLIVEKQPEGITFTVKDTGIGIPADKISQLFQPFSQLDSQLNRHYAGTGLGLALTRKLARLHGGDVTVTSILHQGSTFTLFLPELLTPAAASAPTARQTSTVFTACPKGRILIVEDDTVSAMVLQDYLRAGGYQVLLHTNEERFLQVIQDYEPNLVLLDVQLAGTITGVDLLHELRSHAQFQSLPVVIITALVMAGDREKFLQAGATAYLSKPLNIVQLESVLLDCLE